MRDFITSQERATNFGYLKHEGNDMQLAETNKIGMLVLTRKVGEAIMINDDIKVIILGIKGNQVRIRTIAPMVHRIDREEIRKRKENEQPRNNVPLL